MSVARSFPFPSASSLLAAALAVAFTASFATGCATFRPMTASSEDLEDYRAFRVAAADGTRLARAKRYLERHPQGAFAAEVQRAFDEEEPRYFERAQASKEGARRYLADLPDGPHAQAALALLVSFQSSMEDAELRDIARRLSYEDTKLEAAAVQRRAVGETILSAVGVFLEEDTYGVPLADASPALRALLSGRAETWGAIPARREQDLFYVLPVQSERESRFVTVALSVGLDDGVVGSGRIEGSDLFVRWAEADTITRLDRSLPADRTKAQTHALSRLEGAFERRFPAGACQDLRTGRELYHRGCSGWEATVTPGAAAGENDAIVVVRARKTSPR